MSNSKLPKGNQGQTGPKTDQGKVASAKNSRKSGIFVKGYLDWENPAEKQRIHEALCEQWGANDPTSKIFIASIEQASLEQERIMYAQKRKIDASMMQLNIAQEFARMARLDVLNAHIYPSWYFASDDEDQKMWAIWIDQVWLQAAELQKRFHDALVPQIATQFPQLFEHVMEGQPASSSFLQVLGQRYRQSTPTLNLGGLMNEIREKYPHHLQWAQDPKRYQIIIDGLRADLMLEALDLEKSSRYMTSIQNRYLKAVQALTVLKQMNASNHPSVIELEVLKQEVIDQDGQKPQDFDEGDEMIAA